MKGTNPMKMLLRSVAPCLLAVALASLAVACKGGDGKSADASAKSGDAAATMPATEGAPGSSSPATIPSPATPAPAGSEAPATALPPGHPAIGAPPAPAAPAIPIIPSGPPAQVVAKVNSRTITRGELDFTIKNVVQGNVPPEKQAEVRHSILNHLIDQELIYQKAVASKVEVSPAELTASMAKVKADFPDEKVFTEQLAKDGMTPASIEAMVRHAMVIDKYVKSTVIGQVKVSAEDESAFYDQNKEKMKHPEQVRASHILLRVASGATAEQKAAQKAKAMEALGKARSGSDFGALAREYSQDPSAQRGGDLGYFAKGSMVPAFDQAAFALKTGTISDLVETVFGFHIIKVTDHRAEGYSPIGDVRGKIHEYLTNQKVQDEVQKLADSLRKQSKIETSL
jgi:peptidyl-prolyl cis-trans isomerase C